MPDYRVQVAGNDRVRVPGPSWMIGRPDARENDRVAGASWMVDRVPEDDRHRECLDWFMSE